MEGKLFFQSFPFGFHEKGVPSRLKNGSVA